MSKHAHQTPQPCSLSHPHNLNGSLAPVQAFVRDLGFHDTVVDKIVASAASPPSRNESRNESTTAADANLLVDVADAIERAPTLFGPRTRYQVFVTIPSQLAIMAPMWIVYNVNWPHWLNFYVHLVRVMRLKDLVRFFSDQQEDLAADVRWVAGAGEPMCPLCLSVVLCWKEDECDKIPRP